MTTTHFSHMQNFYSTSWSLGGLVLLVASVFSSAVYANDQIGQQLFLKGAAPACAICHTLDAAGAAGAVGPNLTELQPDASRVLKALQNGIGQMPAYSTLTPEQMKILSEYVAKASRE